MDLDHLKKFSYLEFKEVDHSKLNSSYLGKPVLRLDRGYFEYGIIVGYDEKVVYVHFGNMFMTLKINACDLFFPAVLYKFSGS